MKRKVLIIIAVAICVFSIFSLYSKRSIIPRNIDVHNYSIRDFETNTLLDKSLNVEQFKELEYSKSKYVKEDSFVQSDYEYEIKLYLSDGAVLVVVIGNDSFFYNCKKAETHYMLEENLALLKLKENLNHK